MNIELQSPRPEDARGIINVFYEAWLDTYPNEELGITKENIERSYSKKFDPDYIKNHEEKLRNIPENQRRLVAKDGDLVVGTITLVRNKDNNQLRTVYVLPKYQGKGIGTMLWEGVKDFIDPNKETIVQVVDYNENAIKFYGKLGFVDTGKRWSDEQFKEQIGASLPEMEMVLRK